MICGAGVALLVFPWCGDRRRLRLRQSWSAALLDALGIDLQADLSEVVPGALLVANHISWIDIFVINAALPAAFVSKEEVRHWPVIGWLAAKNDTVFLRRGSRGHARIINEQVAAILDAGKHVAAGNALGRAVFFGQIQAGFQAGAVRQAESVVNIGVGVAAGQVA